MDGGAWPISARGLTCQVHSGNARDPDLPNSARRPGVAALLGGTAGESRRKSGQYQVSDALSYPRLHASYTVAPNEFFPCPTGLGNLSNSPRDGARLLLFLVFNEECLVIAGQNPAMITSLPFVHTARR